MALRSPPDPNDIVFECLMHAPAPELPKRLDLRHFARPARDQGARGTCAAMAGAAIREIMYYRKNGEPCPQLSPEFIYFHRTHTPIPGMYGRDVFRILAKYGTCAEKEMPYDATKPARRAKRHARKYRVARFARVDTPEGLCQALYANGPCFLSLPKHNAGPRFWRAKKSPLRQSTQTGHAVCVVGYTKRGFILQNSWGPEWSDEGCTMLPWADWKYVWEAWVPYEGAGRRRRVPC
jgi:hypothetical protein